jgi:hypothetical protein
LRRKSRGAASHDRQYLAISYLAGVVRSFDLRIVVLISRSVETSLGLSRSNPENDVNPHARDHVGCATMILDRVVDAVLIFGFRAVFS